MKKIIPLFMLVLAVWLIQVQPAQAGFTSFPAGSVIVPMDPCWQPNTDMAITSAFRPTGCDSTSNDRGIFQAYGMIYEMLRNGANVAWVVKPTKVEENQFDMTIAGVLDSATNQTVPPVAKYVRNGTNTNIDPPARTISWTGADTTSYSESFAQHVIDYRGGPFLIHKKFLNSTMWSILDKFSNVKVHVANVSFTAPIDKVLDKVPPKVAILGGNNTAILRDYLLAAGLGAAESLVFEEVTPTQIVEDYLTTPDTAGNTFSLFWAPHWVIDEEVGTMTLASGTTLTAAQAQTSVLSKLRGFIESGNSAFLECASIESMEGSEEGPVNTGKSVWNTPIQEESGWLTSQLPATWSTATPAGSLTPGPRIWTNDGSNDGTKIISDTPTNFLSQCAGWDYEPTGGHVHNYTPHDNVSNIYNDTVERFIHDRDGVYQNFNPGFDYYVGGRINGSPTQGYVTYLAGHRYLECNSSGTETTSTNNTSVAVAAQSDISFSLSIPAAVADSETITYLIYYDGGNTPITATFRADGSSPINGDDAIMALDVQSVNASISGSNRTYSGIVVSNMNTAAHTIDRVNVTWTGCATTTTGATIGSGEYKVKKFDLPDGNEVKFCDENDQPEGDTCGNPSRTVQLTKTDGLEFELEIKEEIVDDDWLFIDFDYGGTDPARIGLQLDRFGASESDGGKKLTLSNAQIRPECATFDNQELTFNLNSLEVKIEFDDPNRTIFKKIKVKHLKLEAPNSSSEPNILSLTATWGSKDTVTCGEPASGTTCALGLNVSSSAPTLSISGDKGDDLSFSPTISLAALNDGGSPPSGDPPPNLIDVSYCDVNWGKTNTCGARYVLNTVLGLQFTVISNTFVQSTPVIDRGITYQGSYEFPTYRGHLQAIDVTDSNFTNAGSILWDAATVMPPAGTTGNPASISSTPASRYIFTNNGTAKVEFEVGSVTQTSDFLHVQMGKASLDATKVLLNTVRGRDKVTTSLLNGEAEQAYRLWGVRTSSPAIVGRSELAKKLTRDRIVYVGGDDGMLHAFYAGSTTSATASYSDGTGKEIWAYIPSLLLPQLQNQNYVDPTKDPAISVSGSPAVRDFLVPIKNSSGVVTGVEYRTLLIGTATIGSQNKGLVFALDVTDPYAPQVLWETDLSNYNIGDANGVSLGKVRNGDSIRNWAFLTANYHQPLAADGTVDLTGGKYGINALALDVMTGTIEWQWNQNYAINNVTETPAIPSLLDIDNNGVVDFMVFGDMDGRLWQIDAHSGHSVISLSGVDQPVFTVSDANGNPLGAPIGTGIALYNNLAVFGTGGTDFADDTAQYGLYAVSLGEREAVLVWEATDKDTNSANFLQAGEKIWGTPMIDNTGRIYIATGKGYQQQVDPGINASTGRVIVLNNEGEVLASVNTETASVGSLALTDGGAVATDFTGNMVRLGSPTVSGENQDVQVKIFSWRLR